MEPIEEKREDLQIDHDQENDDIANISNRPHLKAHLGSFDEHKEDRYVSFAMSPNAFYQQRQNRFTLPQTVLDKLQNEENKNAKKKPEHAEEVFNVLMISNQIRALCQKEGGKIRSAKKLTQRMLQLNLFCDKNVDELWKRSNDIDIHKCIMNLQETLLEAKAYIEDALKVRFRRNSLFNKPVKEINIDVGNRIAALEMALSGDNSMEMGGFGLSPNSNKKMTKATRGELTCIAGHRYYFGHGTKQNYQKSYELYKKSADLNNSDGMNHLAMMYEKGIGIIQNIENAIKYYNLSIQTDKNNNDAKYNLANLYYLHEIYNDIPMAIQLYKQAAENGHNAAQTTLAGLYETGVDEYLQPNIQISIKWYRKASNDGYLEAKNNLAVVLLNNSDINTKEYKQAITLLTESASLGSASSQNNLGHCYEFGKGVKKSVNLAIEWYTKSSLQNYNTSYINLGYLKMKICEYEEAFNYFLKSSKNGINENNVDCFYYLGIMHEKGYFVAINIYLAIEYFRAASDYGHILSALKIGDCYFCGQANIKQDYKKSYKIYESLALDGNEIAANNLGIMNEEGLGRSIDLECAQMWYRIGAEKGYKDAIINDKRLSQLMGKKQLLL